MRILSFISVLLILAAPASAAWVATEPLDYAEGVNLCPTPGGGDCQSGGTGWLAQWKGGNAIWKGEGTIFTEGTGSVSNDAGNSGDGTKNDRILATSVTDGIVKFSMYHQTLAAGRGIRFRLLENSAATTTPFYVELASTGLILSGATNVTLVASPVADTWYTVHVSFDTAANTAKARLDADTAWSATVAEAAATAGIDAIDLYVVGDPLLGNEGYIDNINVGSEPPATDVPRTFWEWWWFFFGL